MGFDSYGARFLLHAADVGVEFSSTATLGHQSFVVGQSELAAALVSSGRDPSSSEAILRDSGGWVDGFLRFLGAETVDSVDASDYEQASVIHDLNAPVPESLVGRYSAVVEAGTLEHVFNVPTSWDNAMRMVKLDGHLLLSLPVNQFAGHGFYQFSPELVFRVLSPKYGYRVREALLMEAGHAWPRWYRVTDPAALGRRMAFRSDMPVLLYVIAQRVGDVPGFSSPPMQSDYVAEWEDGDGAPVGVPGPRGGPRATRSDNAVTLQKVVRHAVSLAPERSRRASRWAISWAAHVPNYRSSHVGFQLVREPWTT